VIHHVDFTVSDLERSEAFYSRALAPLGMAVVYRNPDNRRGGRTIGFGSGGDPFFCLRSGAAATTPMHVAFVAATRAQVDAFHAAAIAAGGADNGAPGLRAHYADAYYAAYVIDPDGHNIETVCRAGATGGSARDS
jgi:catechol 2,3-dioxygenase-like lactoylglutathione lyase family enzyme